MPSMKESALNYAKMGLAVFPVKERSKYPATQNGFKDATTDSTVISNWWDKNPNYNIGIATGGRSNGIFVIDLDIDEDKGLDGLEELKSWENNNELLPDTCQSITGRGGIHLFYKSNQNIKCRTNLLRGIDIRGEGGYIVAPPSMHENGRQYEWEQSLEEFVLEEANATVYQFLNQAKATTEKKASYSVPNEIQQGERTATMFKLVSSLQAKGLTDEAIKAAVSAENETKCNPPLSVKELEKEVFPALKRYEKGIHSYKKNNIEKGFLLDRLKKIKPEDVYTWDDKGNGALFADVFKDRCRFNITAKEWYQYNGKNWLEDTGGMEVSILAKQLANELLLYSFSLEETKKEPYRKHIMRLGQLRYRKTMIEDARDKYYISADDLDKDPYQFNCKNGVLNLKTFEFKEHNSSDLLSKISNVVYDPKIRSTDFINFMEQIMQGDKDKIDYLQKILGYALTGDTREESAYFLYGATTRNGKGTLMGTYDYMMGSTEGYAMNILPETLAQKKSKDSRQASGDIARLKSCRFLNMSEPPKRMIFDVALFKTLLGRDPITARHLREREFEFQPIFKLFINTNFLPVMTDDTVFTSGRVNVITFDKHFNELERDKGLKERLRQAENISGVFNWCIEGLKSFYLMGATPPAAVQASTNEYRSNSDKIGNFIEECLEVSERNIKAKDVYDEFNTWCTSYGYGAENKGNFFAELKAKGLLASQGKINGVAYKNVVKGYTIGKWKNVNFSFEDIKGR